MYGSHPSDEAQSSRLTTAQQCKTKATPLPPTPPARCIQHTPPHQLPGIAPWGAHSECHVGVLNNNPKNHPYSLSASCKQHGSCIQIKPDKFVPLQCSCRRCARARRRPCAQTHQGERQPAAADPPATVKMTGRQPPESLILLQMPLAAQTP